jgi:hypothetical protein
MAASNPPEGDTFATSANIEAVMTGIKLLRPVAPNLQSLVVRYYPSPWTLDEPETEPLPQQERERLKQLARKVIQEAGFNNLHEVQLRATRWVSVPVRRGKGPLFRKSEQPH